jgi:phosphoglycolate phosphatase
MPKLFDYIEAVAFDLDGTLVDTAPDLAAAANMMLTLLGIRPLPELHIPALIGDGIDRFVAEVLKQSRDGRTAPDSALFASAAALFRDLYREYLFERSRVYPGVMETLRALESAGVFSCCITNKESTFAVPLLEAAGIREPLAFALCADRAEDRKPSPSLLLLACARLGVKPPRMLYVGDARSDIVAARAAGCRVVAVDYGYHRDLPLVDPQPDGIVSNLTELISLQMRPRMGEAALRSAS